jgi:hypothetical protein
VEEGDSVTMVMEYVGNTEGDKTVEMERAVTVRHVILSIYCHT